MKQSIKLKDLTAKQWNDNMGCECNKYKDCNGCRFRYIDCSTSNFESSWINHKEIFNDKFLDQEVEIEVPDILTKEEKEYLSNIIKPFRDEIDCIFKHKNDMTFKSYISIKLKDKTYIHFPDLKDNKMYAKMEIDYHYTLEELDL